MPKVRESWKRGRVLLVELLVIVVGVLIALGVDEWRQSLRDRATEIQYVERLSQDLDGDVRGLMSQLDALTEKRESLSELLEASRDEPSGADGLLAVARSLASASHGSWGNLPAERTTFDELLSTGSLGLIRRTEVRQAIASHYRSYEWESELLVRRITPFPRMSYRLVRRADERSEEEQLTHQQRSVGYPTPNDFEVGTLLEEDLARLSLAMSTDGFIEAITAELNRTNYHLTVTREALTSTKSLRASLEAYLGQ